MSSNHTWMSSETFQALLEEHEQLRQGNGEEMRKVERKVRDRLKKMKDDGKKGIERLNKQRQKNVEHLQIQTQRLLDSMSDANAHATDVQEQLKQLTVAAQQAVSSVDKIVSDTKNQFAKAEDLYQEVSRQFAMTELDVAYQRFAAGMQESIRTRLERINNKEVSGDAMQMLTVSIMNDIYLMDIDVAHKRAIFDTRYLEAAQLADTILAHCTNAKNNFADKDGKKISIDFWTDGRHELLIKETEAIQKRLESGHDNAGYSMEQLSADLQRLQELDKIEQQLAIEAIESYNHSLNREAQALTCMDVLVDKHDFMVLGAGFDMNDPREAYVVRMIRQSDGAQVEVIVNQGQKDGEYDVYFRLDSTTYQDEQLMETITSSIASDFEAAGVKMQLYKRCSPEPLEPFTPGKIQVSDAARRRHGIQRKQRSSSI